MKIQNYVGLILSYGALVQFMKWIFDSINVQDYFVKTLSFFFANISAVLIILGIAVYSLQKRSNKIEKILKQRGLMKMEEQMTLNLMKRIIGKKGFFDVDARFILIVMALLILWLLWKAGKLPF